MEIIGLIPAGGVAERLGKLPCSKELFPFFRESGKITVIAENLIRYYRLAGINNIYFIIRKGKWDIPEYFGDGSAFGVNIGYLTMNLPYGTPFTLNQAYPFIQDKVIALGFPDIVFNPENAFEKLKSKLLNSAAEVVLGLAASNNFLKSDMVEFNHDNAIGKIIIKQNRTDLKYSWFIAVWKPSFTAYMNEYLNLFLKQYPNGKILMDNGSSREIYVGDVIQGALLKGIKIDYVLFEKGHYLDIGTLDELEKVVIKKYNF